LKEKRAIQNGLKNKIMYLKKENRVLKEFQRKHHIELCTNKLRRSITTEIDAPSSSNDTLLGTSDFLKKMQAQIEKYIGMINPVTERLNQQKENDSNGSCQEAVNILSEVNHGMTTLHGQIEDHYTNVCSSGRTVNSVEHEKIKSDLVALNKQRKYMLDHMTSTNKRLETLLSVMKGEEGEVDDMKGPNSEVTSPTSPDNKKMRQLGSSNPELEKTNHVLTRVRRSFKSDQNILKSAVSILELTKAISVSDVSQLRDCDAKDEEHLKVLTAVELMNCNMEKVLRETRSNLKHWKDSTRTLVSSEKSESKVSVATETMTTPIELEESLQQAQSKLEELSKFLAKREVDIKVRDEAIAKLKAEYDRLKRDKEEGLKLDETKDKLLVEYATTKERLEKENDFLQLVLKELREEFFNVQRAHRSELETKKNLEDHVKELQFSKNSLENSLDKLGFEMSMIQRDRDHLMRTIHYMNSTRSFHGGPWYDDPLALNAGMLPPQAMITAGPGQDCFYPDCDICSMKGPSESSAFPFSDDDCECTGSCDEFNSFSSELDVDDEGNVVSSSESQTTSSRVAKKLTTVEAAHAIKSKNRSERSPRYLRNETRRAGRHAMSPTQQARQQHIRDRHTRTDKHTDSNQIPISRESSFVSAADSDSTYLTTSETSSSQTRVKGRREQRQSIESQREQYPRSKSTDLNLQDSQTKHQSPLRSISATECRDGQGSGSEPTSPRSHILKDAELPVLYPGHDCKKRKKKTFSAFGKK